MGYITSYYGKIYLFDKKAIKIIKKMIKEEEEPFGGSLEDDISVNDTNKKAIILDINCNWKDYDDLMIKLCLFVAILDKKSYGVIKCEGEEVGDIWKIKVEEGNAYGKQGRIIYDNGKKFDDTKIKKQVYEITKDKELMKELITEGLK